MAARIMIFVIKMVEIAKLLTARPYIHDIKELSKKKQLMIKTSGNKSCISFREIRFYNLISTVEIYILIGIMILSAWS